MFNNKWKKKYQHLEGDFKELENAHSQYYNAITQYAAAMLQQFDADEVEDFISRSRSGETFTNFDILSKVMEYIQHSQEAIEDVRRLEDENKRLRYSIDILAQEDDSKFLEK